MPSIKELPDVNYLRQLLIYEPDTGLFRWRYRHNSKRGWNKKFAGQIAGSITKDGYKQIPIDGIFYKAHRLAYLYVYGEDPDYIDHKKVHKSKSNNIIYNLRNATHSQNRANKKIMKTNTSGFKGVSKAKNSKKWTATIGFQGKKIYLGSYFTPEDAHKSYCEAAKKYFGEYARFK